MSDNSKTRPCPFCGNKRPVDFQMTQGMTWGQAVCPVCRACGPEVLTHYDTSEDAEWKEVALIEWNKRTK